MRLGFGTVSCLAVAALLAGASDAQPVVRKATTVSALLRYGSFFHAQPVVVRGRLRDDAGGLWVEGRDDTIQVIGGLESQAASGPDGEVELRGVLWDLGRMQQDDPRLAGYDLAPLLAILTDRDWPRPGEILVLGSASTVDFTDATTPTIRGVALDPSRWADQDVTLTGRFRGRNLYGDLAQAPRLSRWDFVLQSGDAAVWVTGREPKGDGFELSLTARADTGRWLAVTGTLSYGEGLVWIEARDLEAAEPPVESSPSAGPQPSPLLGPPPEVIFSAPIQDDTDIAVDDPVRIQFSQDMDGASFDGHVRAAYVGDVAPLSVSTRYRPGNRVLEVMFVEPLEPFRTVRVELLDGILSVDGQPLAPWTLTYSVGG